MTNQTKDNILLIDIGNSSLKWAEYSVHGLSGMSSQRYPENITSAFFKECWKELDKPDEVVASCVANESVWQALAEACDELWSLKVQKVGSLKQGFGLDNAYDNASALGSDRWCAMIGAFQIVDSAFLVISAGSALTFDMVDESGKHMGGYIVPGIGMMRESLGYQTALVKTKSTENIPSLSLANSTEQCVEAGIYLSAVKLIEAVYERESKQVKQLKCFLTGGDAPIIEGLLSFKCVIMPELVLRGLAVIATNN